MEEQSDSAAYCLRSVGDYDPWFLCGVSRRKLHHFLQSTLHPELVVEESSALRLPLGGSMVGPH